MTRPDTPTLRTLHWAVMRKCIGFTFRVSVIALGDPLEALEWRLMKRLLGR